MRTFDVETSSDGSLLSIATFDGTRSQFFYKPSGEELIDLLKDDDKNPTWAGHNTAYDLSALASVIGVSRIPRIAFDSWIAARFLYPAQQWSAGELTLKTLCYEKLGIKPWGSASALIKEYGSMEAVPFDELRDYNIDDAQNNWLLVNFLLGEFDNILGTKMFQIVRLESQLISTILKMKLAGVMLDKEVLGKIQSDLVSDITNLTSQIYEYGNVCLSSPSDVSRFLFTVLGINPKKTPKTKTGFYSTNAKALELLQYDHPVVSLILNWRSLNQLSTHFVSGLVSTSKNDPVIHANWNQFGAATGRFSATGPALQTIPSKERTGKYLRRAFIARPGYKFYVADYSQIQLRIMGAFCSSKNVAKVFASGGDIHEATFMGMASLLDFKAVSSTITSDQRKLAKACNFGLIFGMGPGGLMHVKLDGKSLTWDQAVAFRAAFFTFFDGLETYHKNTLRQSYKGVVYSWFGRPVPCIPGNISCYNLPIQSTEADIMKMAMVRLDKSLYEINSGACIILQVHDELVIECPCEEDILPTILTSMQDIQFPIPLIADVKVGTNWLETEKVI